MINEKPAMATQKTIECSDCGNRYLAEFIEKHRKHHCEKPGQAANEDAFNTARRMGKQGSIGTALKAAEPCKFSRTKDASNCTKDPCCMDPAVATQEPQCTGFDGDINECPACSASNVTFQKEQCLRCKHGELECDCFKQVTSQEGQPK
jgi:hypothetical protein